jgi:hypothetical protein
MQYQVPQFIEIEDKIFGPLTLKQFLYLAGVTGVCLALFTLLPIYIAAIIAVPFVILGLALAFYQVNDRPFVVTLEYAFKYYIGSKLYLWKQREQTPLHPEQAKTQPATQSALAVPSLSESKLHDLSWSLNIKDRTQMGVIDPQKPQPNI